MIGEGAAPPGMVQERNAGAQWRICIEALNESYFTLTVYDLQTLQASRGGLISAVAVHC